MDPRHLAAALIGFTAVIAAPTVATATNLLTEKNLESICLPLDQWDGVVDRVELASLLLGEARVPQYLRERGREAARAFNAQRKSSGDTTPAFAELVYIIENVEDTDAGPGMPFGTAGSDRDDYKSAKARLQTQLNLLQNDLTHYRMKTKGPFRLPGGERVLVADFFAQGSEIVITCHRKAMSPVQTSGEGKPDGPEFRLARNARGLPGPAEDRADVLKSVDPAELFFENNIEQSETLFGIDGAVGLWARPGGINGQYEYLGFVEYKRRSSGDKSEEKDIHTVAPGASVVYTDNLASTPFYIALSPKFLFDLEQDSSRFVVDVTGERYFDLTDNIGIGRFGTFTDNGTLEVRPDITGQARAATVLDAGSDTKLQGVDDYVAIGAIAELEFAMPDVTPFENLTLAFSFNHLQFVAGNLRRDNANRFDAALRYAPGGNDNFVVSLGYSNGEDMNTFQREEAYLAKLGLRY